MLHVRGCVFRNELCSVASYTAHSPQAMQRHPAAGVATDTATGLLMSIAIRMYW